MMMVLLQEEVETNNATPLKKQRNLPYNCKKTESGGLTRCVLHRDPPISANQSGQLELACKDDVVVDMCVDGMFIPQALNDEYGTII